MRFFSLLQPSVVRANVRPGAGLTQFPVQLLNQISLHDFHEALGGNFSSNLQGIIRRWKLAASSWQDVTANHHVVLPLWENDQWSCLGCQRLANLTRDPAWAAKTCSRPWTQPIDMRPIQNAITFLEQLLNKLRFQAFPIHLLPDFTPDPQQLIHDLEQQVNLLTLPPLLSGLLFLLNIPDSLLKGKTFSFGGRLFRNHGIMLLIPSSRTPLLRLRAFALLVLLLPRTFNLFFVLLVLYTGWTMPMILSGVDYLLSIKAFRMLNLLLVTPMILHLS